MAETDNWCPICGDEGGHKSNCAFLMRVESEPELIEKMRVLQIAAAEVMLTPGAPKTIGEMYLEISREKTRMNRRD